MMILEYIGVTLVATGILGMWYTENNSTASMGKAAVSFVIWMIVTGVGCLALIIRLLVWFFSRWF